MATRKQRPPEPPEAGEEKLDRWTAQRKAAFILSWKSSRGRSRCPRPAAREVASVF